MVQVQPGYWGNDDTVIYRFADIYPVILAAGYNGLFKLRKKHEGIRGVDSLELVHPFLLSSLSVDMDKQRLQADNYQSGTDMRTEVRTEMRT